MSFSMSPPPQKPTPTPYPPQAYPNSVSPSAQSPFAPPPAKRQRLSPDPRSPQNGTSPYNAPPHAGPGPFTNQYTPHSAVQSPYSPGGYSAVSPQHNSFNTPQPYSPQSTPYAQQHSQQSQFQASPPPSASQSSQMMPPPPRPNKEEKDERIGVEDIGDSLFGSGINLKDEENYLHSTWNNRHATGESFNTTQSTSFGSGTLSPNNSFNVLTQGTSFGSQNRDGAFAGTIGQTLSQEDIEAEVRRKRETAARSKAERDQHHLNNQFLLGNCVRNRMHQRAYENGVKLDVQGVYLRKAEPQTTVMTNGEATEGIVSVNAESLIESGVQYEHILSLVSLATCERLRGLVDEAYGLSRARQYGDHGRVVPPEFADIATGEGRRRQESVTPENITGSQWDRVPDADDTTNADENSQPNGHEQGTPQPVQTISFQGTLTKSLRELAERDRLAEKERQKRRDARKRKGDNLSTDGPTSEPASEAPVVTEAAAPVKMSKKEATKKAKESSSQNAEAQSFNQSNQTAAMMALGKKGNRYSWMSGGASNMPTNRFAKPNAPKAETPVSATAAPVTAVPGNPSPAKEAKPEENVPTWGDWREDKGIQLRDWVFVLEHDGREKKALQRAINKFH